MSRFFEEFSANPTVTVQTYAKSKVIGGLIPLTGILAPCGAEESRLESLSLLFAASAQSVNFWVAIFGTIPTGTFTDTNTAAIAATDSAFLIGMYEFDSTSSSSLLGTHTIYSLQGIDQNLQLASTETLYAVIVADNTTATLGGAKDMTLRVGIGWP